MENKKENLKYIRYLYRLRSIAKCSVDKEFFTYLIYCYYHFNWRYTTSEIRSLLLQLK